MFVKSIDWIDEEAQEAEVIVSDGSVSILCFSHPFKKNVNDILAEPIHCLDAENVAVSEEQVAYANRSNTTFGYSICGKLADKENKIALLGNIKLCLEDAYIPDSIPEGSFIAFDVSRFDLY
ncbi:MAG: hypothetical protein LBK69_03035 [Syntrophomonadaceae bacterium]|jgi:hypothetical protein|nr:hypothetical protein [Syntrophomonadaceae bacterium]